MTFFSELNANPFLYNRAFYLREFEDILAKVVICYQIMITNRVKVPKNENAIRDILVNDFLNNHILKRTIGFNYIVNPEVPQAHSSGRPDIKIQAPNGLLPREAYYTIECKVIDAINQTGTTGLNAKYIKDGICRFTSATYSSYYHANGMIGFVVAKIDIPENVKYINALMTDSFDQDCCPIDVLTQRTILDGFEYTYCSAHQLNENQITIYHLMLDFSENILAD